MVYKFFYFILKKFNITQKIITTNLFKYRVKADAAHHYKQHNFWNIEVYFYRPIGSISMFWKEKKISLEELSDRIKYYQRVSTAVWDKYAMIDTHNQKGFTDLLNFTHYG